jgi:hypothetical protein
MTPQGNAYALLLSKKIIERPTAIFPLGRRRIGPVQVPLRQPELISLVLR